MTDNQNNKTPTNIGLIILIIIGLFVLFSILMNGVTQKFYELNQAIKETNEKLEVQMEPIPDDAEVVNLTIYINGTKRLDEYLSIEETRDLFVPPLQPKVEKQPKATPYPQDDEQISCGAYVTPCCEKHPNWDDEIHAPKTKGEALERSGCSGCE